ncbi:MAG TPA: serine hydrolase domain-containing protein [Vicinamibacterales bacterium]
MKQLLVLFLALVLLQSPSSVTREPLDAFLAARVAAGDVPAVVAMLVSADQTLYVGAAGKASVAGNKPVAADSIFRIASMTKPITSLAAMMLVEEGKLRVDDPVANYLPELAGLRVITAMRPADGTFESRPPARPITMRDLLTHTSGLAYSFVDARLTKLDDGKRGELDFPLLHDPGAKFTYGPSTAVVGRVIEKVSGQPLDVFFKTRIFDPLGMHDTFFVVPADKRDRVVTLHTRGGENGALAEAPNGAKLDSPAKGDGGLFSTAADYARFMQLILNRGRVGTQRLLREDTIAAMTSNQIGRIRVSQQASTNLAILRPFPIGAGKDTFGFGFQIEEAPAAPGLRSAGSLSWGGVFNTHFWIDPHRSIAGVVMMQVLPYYDARALEVARGFERLTYQRLRRGK